VGSVIDTLKAGDAAPDFTALDDRGERISLADFTGHVVVLFFYPKDDTPG
jgi:thioredoxin-dependent peroxiredoxin